MEPPRTRSELDSLFKELSKTIIVEDSLDSSLVKKLEALSSAVSKLSIFSNNEEFDDVDTDDLGFALADFWLASALTKDEIGAQPNPSRRISRLETAKAHLERFLLRCTNLKLYKPKSEKEESKTKKTAPISREEKISRFKAKKYATENLKNSADEREQWKFRLEAACMDALDEIDAIDRELEILQYMAKQGPMLNEIQQSPHIVNKPIEITKIGKNLEIKKETLQAGVFKPYHNLPTVSLEEYAELEMKKLEEQEKRNKQKALEEAEHGPKNISLTELYEQGLEDDTKLEENATMKARKWDDWKDGVPKGSGITRRF